MARIRDNIRDYEFFSDDPRVIAKAKKGGDYEIISEETPEQAREREVGEMLKDDLITLAGSYSLVTDGFKKKEDYVKAILAHERGVTTNAPAA